MPTRCIRNYKLYHKEHTRASRKPPTLHKTLNHLWLILHYNYTLRHTHAYTCPVNEYFPTFYTN